MLYHQLRALRFASIVAVAFFGASAYAAERYSWTGFYTGANGGYLWGNAKFEWMPGPAFLDPSNDLPTILGIANKTLHPSGFIGGLTAGYNYRIGNVIWGWEGDLDYVDASKTRFVDLSPILASPPGNTITESVKINWLATFRPRVGLASDRSLIFVTGGLAVGGVNYSTIHTYAAVPPGAGSNNGTRAGWTASGGYEFDLNNQWTMKTEYLYVDLGKASFSEFSSFGLPADSFMTHNQRFTASILRVGFNYKFGSR